MHFWVILTLSLTLFFFFKSVVMEMHSFWEEEGAEKNVFVITF